MIQLTRQFRCYLRPTGLPTSCHNNWSGVGADWNFAPFLQLECTVEGEPSQPSGYLCDIKQLDDACRQAVDGALRSNTSSNGPIDAPTDAPTDSPSDDPTAASGSHRMLFHWLMEVQQELQRAIPPAMDLVKLVCRVSPFMSFSWRRESSHMIAVTQQFEFSAAHRLHCPDWSDEENRRTFGKCNHPNGHGHNYVVEITLDEISQNGQTPPVAVSEIEQVVRQRVVDRLDHKHLNLDVPEFGKTNPSVENIAQVIWQWLVGQFSCGRLHNVRVYETPKTWADYSGR